MRLYFMRHGYAVKEQPSMKDFQRTLTDTGRRETLRQARLIASGLKGKKATVYISPAVRTQQTAEILLEVLTAAGVETTSSTVYALARPDWEPVDNLLLNTLAGSSIEDVFLVSHQPFLEAWVAQLTGAHLPFRQSGIAVVDYRRLKKNKLAAYLTPLWEMNA